MFANVLIGPEKSNNTSDTRTVVDVMGTLAIIDRVTFGFNGDYGTEEHSSVSNGNAVWDGVALYCRLNLTDKFSLNVRGEQFEDLDGIRTGVPQLLREITFTPEYRLAGHMVVRADWRVDKSTVKGFPTGANWKDTQSTIGVNILYAF